MHKNPINGLLKITASSTQRGLYSQFNSNFIGKSASSLWPNIDIDYNFSTVGHRASYMVCVFLVSRPFQPYKNIDLVTLTYIFDLDGSICDSQTHLV